MIKESIVSMLKQAGFVRKKWVDSAILDRSFRVINGSIRHKADKDDAWLFELSRHNNAIYDIGCNIGQATLMMLINTNIRQILLADPNPQALAIAAENLIHNNLSAKASFICAFISSEMNEKVDFYTQESGAAGSRYKGFAKTAAKLNSHYEVSTVTVDHLVKFYGWIPDLVKVDVEGAEIDVLKGAVDLASQRKTIFFVEVHSGPELEIVKNTSDILDWCKANSYTAWYLKSKSPLNTELIASRGRYHALLIPAEMKFPNYLESISEGDPLRK